MSNELGRAGPPGIVWARECAEPDWLAAKRGPRKAVKKAGLAYERSAGTALANVVATAFPWARLAPHQWFTFGLPGKTSWCQTDFLVVGPEEVLIVECKLSFVQTGLEQLARYAPIVEAALGRRATGLLLCKNLRPEARGHMIVSSLAQGWAYGRAGHPAVLHWLGRGPITP